MNNDLNSDSEQCTESKLGRVQKVHTLNSGSAHSAMSQHTLGHVVAMSWPCRSVVSFALLPCRDTKTLPPPPPPPPPFAIQKLYLDIKLMSRALPRMPQHSCAVSQGTGRRIAAPGAIYHDTRPPSRPDTNDCIATHPSDQAPRALAATRCTRRLAVSQGILAVSQGRVIRLLAVSWPPFMHPCTPVS